MKSFIQSLAAASSLATMLAAPPAFARCIGLVDADTPNMDSPQ